MIWHPETHLAEFQAWASRFPVREPFGRLRHATQNDTPAQQRQKAGGIAKSRKEQRKEFWEAKKL